MRYRRPPSDHRQSTLVCNPNSMAWIVSPVLYRNLFSPASSSSAKKMKAVWLAGEDTVTFYDAQGELLRTVRLEEQTVRKAA